MKHEIQYLLQVISCKRLYWSLFITEGGGGGGQGGKGGSEDLGCVKIRLT